MNAVQAGQANWIQQLRQQQRQYAAAARASWLFIRSTDLPGATLPPTPSQWSISMPTTTSAQNGPQLLTAETRETVSASIYLTQAFDTVVIHT